MKFDMRAKIIASIVGLALLTGAECGSKGSNGDSGGDAAGDAKKTHAPTNPAGGLDPWVHLQTSVDEGSSPYEVVVAIVGGTGWQPNKPIPVAGGVWQHDVIYATGKKLTITLTVNPSRPGPQDGKSHGYCRIVDGAKQEEQKLYHLGSVVCQLNTSQ